MDFRKSFCVSFRYSIAFVRSAGVKVVDNLYGDSLGPPGSGADTYIGMMRTDTTKIVEALR